MYEDAIPFSKVLDNNFVARKVIKTAKKMNSDKSNAAITVLPLPELIPTKNMLIMVINIGNLPLHGIKPFVRVASKRSLGESIIRAPVTPTALHPNPMHIVRACFPQALHL